MKALIIANGEVPSPGTIDYFARLSDLILVTDGAAEKIAPGAAVSYICGDFDSIKAEQALGFHPRAKITLLPDQNSSDLEKTIDFARKQGINEITIAGAFGGRIDHTLVLFSLMIKYHRVLRVSAVDDTFQTYFLSPDCALHGRIARHCSAESLVSVSSFAEKTKVSVEGVRWPLSAFPLAPGSHGVSNRALGGIVSVSVRQGIAAVSLPWTTHGNQ